MEDILKYLNTVKQIENNYTGIESYEDDVAFEDAYEDANMPYNVNDIRVEQKMITVFQVEYWISDGKT